MVSAYLNRSTYLSVLNIALVAGILIITFYSVYKAVTVMALSDYKIKNQVADDKSNVRVTGNYSYNVIHTAVWRRYGYM